MVLTFTVRLLIQQFLNCHDLPFKNGLVISCTDAAFLEPEQRRTVTSPYRVL